MRSIKVLAMLVLMLALMGLPVSAADTDGDGLSDAFEQRYGVTDFQDPDTDGDGVIDSAEDNDGDDLGNKGEQRFRTHPGKRDTDRDGRPDGKEDADRDGRKNKFEQDQPPLPAALTPSLKRAADDEQPNRTDCQVKHGTWRVKKCVFGDPASSTTLTLVGDSNMTMYLTPLKRIAKERGWRLELMAKSSCPSFLGLQGLLQSTIDGGVTCRKWRRAMLDELRADPPDYLMFANVSYALVTVKGKPIPGRKRPGVWKDAVKRTLKQLPARTDVVVLGTLPKNDGNPVNCLKVNRKDMSRCTHRRIPSDKRRVDLAIRAGATAGGGAYASLHGRICTYDPCPVVHGNVLLWRNGVHVSETFAKRLQPALAGIIERKLVRAK